ncbi:metalloprotease, partial [Multifurca ochricompacta]
TSICLAYPGPVSNPLSTIYDRRVCGTTISEETLIAAEKHFAENKVNYVTQVEGSSHNTTISVYFHVISADETYERGYLSDSQVRSQVDALNSAYVDTDLSFDLVEVNHIVNVDWFENASPETSQQSEMKQALRRGGAGDLNIYTVGFTSGERLLGYATFPYDYRYDSQDDGVVFLFSTIPDGGEIDYEQGKTAVHEVGHWLGLYHTFEGGCDGEGDHVEDTPPEAAPAFGCPEGIDTCISPGLDPIHNFMDYTDDSCMNQFTPGQIDRFKTQLATYRGISV